VYFEIQKLECSEYYHQRQMPKRVPGLTRDYNPEKNSMSKIVDEVIAANKKYATNFGSKKDLALPPARDPDLYGCPS
jgi:hypothetical protein